MNNKHNNTCYCQIRVSVVFISILVVGMLLVSCYFRDEIYHAWLESEGKETVSYVGIESELDNIRECRLCGSSNDSMMDYYRQFNTLGIICVNDWNVLELETRTQDEFGNETKNNLGTRESMGSTSEYKYKTCSVPERGIAEVTIMLPEEYSPNILSLQKILCQECLDKILESLEFDKWKKEKSEAIPMCLVDFQTLEIYSLQMISHKRYIDEFYVKSFVKDRELYVEAIVTR